jgi:lysophospholipase
MAMTPCRSNTSLILPFTGQCILTPHLSSSPNSTGTFKLDYTPLHTRLFLDQVHANIIGGFVPDTNSPDPDFGKCLQCIAIDRARFNVNPPAARSAICARCLQQYCFDPNNLTSASDLPGRKLNFVDPDPQGVSAVTGFLAEGKVPLVLGFLGLALVIAAISTFLYVSLFLQVRCCSDGSSDVGY